MAERIVFRYLRKEKIYFQKHYQKVIGTPDVSLPRKKKAVFVDSDFWHGRDMEKAPKTEFWIQKINRNKQRDNKVNETLAGSGWKVLRVWESDIIRKRTRDEELRRIALFLTD